MTTIKIDKNIPPPGGLYANGGRPGKYPWAEMKPGHSFWIPIGKRTAAEIRCLLLNNAKSWAARSGLMWRFAVRNEPHGPRASQQGVRIWRIQ